MVEEVTNENTVIVVKDGEAEWALKPEWVSAALDKHGLCIMPKEMLTPAMSRAVFERLNNPTQPDEESAKAASWDFVVAYPVAVSAFQQQLKGGVMTDTHKPDISREAVEEYLSAPVWREADAVALIRALRDELDKAEEALRPFAEFAPAIKVHRQWGGYRLIGNGFDVEITEAHFDAAAARLKQGE